MFATQESRNQWYVLRGEDKYGPFEYSAMIRMLQKNELFDYNYIWAPHLESWTLLGEIADFSKDRLARLIENNAEVKSAFFKRAFERVDVNIEVYGHNQHLFFDGHTLSVSANGALLLLNSPLLLPGVDLHLHFRKGAKTEAFNVTAEIVRKNFTRNRINVKSGLHYAVRFKEISESGKKILDLIVKENSKEAKQ